MSSQIKRRNDIYEEMLTRAYIDAHDHGVEIPWDGRINWEEWPDTIQPFLERRMEEAIDRGWFDYGAKLTKEQHSCRSPWHRRPATLIARRAWGEALIRIHAHTDV